MKNYKGFHTIPLIIIIVVVLLVGFSGYIYITRTNDQTQNTNLTTDSFKNEATKLIDTINIPEAQASSFATYEAVNVNIDPQVKDFEINEDFSNVHNKDQISFLLSNTDAKEKLLNNRFVVQPSWYDEFFSVYERNRYSYTPSFITTDSLLHNYHLLFDHLLKQTEEGFLIDKLKELNVIMLEASQEQYEELETTDWANAARRNVAFFTVSSVLLDDSVVIPDIVKDEVERELNLIEEHSGINDAIVINMGSESGESIPTPQGMLSLDLLKEDYSQYIPRGHYDKSEELKAYFKTMMWLGRLTFRLKSTDETASAALITQALLNTDRSSLWDTIYEPTNFFVGKSDDITYYDLKDLLLESYGENVTVSQLASNPATFDTFYSKARNLDPPKINSIPVFQSSIQPDREEEIKGFRFMGQRFTIDASIMQKLVCRDVGTKRGSMDCGGTVPGSRMTPKGLDITAAMGSNEAYEILGTMGETEYMSYPENMELLQEYINGLDISIWTQNLYWGWLYSIKPLTEVVSGGYPFFMQNDSWIRKDLNSYLGSWTELKHDTILYTKQVYAELGGGPSPEYDDRGYVEPRPEVFARLAALTKITKEGLEIRGLISENMKDSLDRMETLAISLKIISEKELNNESRTEEEYELIRSYGGQLEHFWLDINKEDLEKSGMPQRDFLNENPAAIVADVATDPNGIVLEEATGKIDKIYVLVEVEGVVKVAEGGVYSYYEFLWPLSDRLTDKKWRELLNSDETPERPEWTNDFISSN